MIPALADVRDIDAELGFFLPCLNEAQSIGPVVTSLRRRFAGATIVVVDDGSLDDTAKVAAEAGAFVARMSTNMGIATACLAGLACCRELGCKRIVRLDGDGQHAVDDVVRLLSVGDADLVVGSRYIGGDRYTSLMRGVGIGVLRLAFRILHRRHVSDPTSGFRAYSARVADFLLASPYPVDYPEPEEVAAVLSSRQFTLAEVAVEVRARAHGASTITSARSVYFMVKVCIALILRRALLL